MAIHDLQNDDFLRRWLLGSSEAGVLSPSDERQLLLELADCRRRFAEAATKPDGPGPESSQTAAALHRIAGSTLDPGSAEIRAIAGRYQEIRTALALANVRLVAHVAKRYKERGISASDLIQEGICGLLVAIDRFDPANTGRLATYAVWWIRQAVQRAVAAGAYPVRLNPKQLRRLAQTRGDHDEVVRDLRPHSGRPGPDRSHANPSALAAIRPQFSLDTACGDQGRLTLTDLLVVSQDPLREHAEDVDEFVTGMVSTLGAREQLVLKLRFGLEGETRHSLSQISSLLGVSKERIRQIQDRAIKKLRGLAKRKGHWEAIDLI